MDNDDNIENPDDHHHSSSSPSSPMMVMNGDDDDGHSSSRNNNDNHFFDAYQDENWTGEQPPLPSSAEHHFFDQEPPKLRAIIYAEFDNDIGRVVRFQVPDEIFDKQRFDTISSAIIPSEEMRDRMIKINMYDYKITGHPVGIKDKKYPREVYIFNMCFVVASNNSVSDDDSIYEPLVQKCAEYLVELEKERCFLSEEKHRLPALMHQIFEGINGRGECICPITDQTTLYLRLCPAFGGIQQIPPHPLSPFLVPVFTRLPPPITGDALNRMDVLSQKICPKIDGVRCIKDIADDLKIDNDLVGRCIRNLCLHGCLALLPLFLYSNCYVPTARLRHFFDSQRMVEQCLAFVALRPYSQPVQFTDMARLYLAMKPGTPLSDWKHRMRPRELGVDERKLVQFGMFYGFLRKQQVYPVAIHQDGTKIAALCTGEQSLDALALHYFCSPVDLHARLADNGNFRFIVR